MYLDTRELDNGGDDTGISVGDDFIPQHLSAPLHGFVKLRAAAFDTAHFGGASALDLGTIEGVGAVNEEDDLDIGLLGDDFWLGCQTI